MDWTKVITEPLGLAGFALFLVFGVLSRVKRQKELRWMGPVAAGMAILALAVGLTLAYLKASRQAPAPVSTPAAAAPQTQTNQVVQKTTGAGSPVVQGVQGDVTITVDQSSGTGKKKAPPVKKIKTSDK